MPGRDSYGSAGKWIHDRAHSIMEDGETPKDTAYAVATQQAHAVKKSPKGFRTPQGVRTAKKKYDEPKMLQKTAMVSGMFDELEKIGFLGFKTPKFLKSPKMKAFGHGVKHEIGPAMGATVGAGIAKMYGVDPLAGAAAGYGIGALPDIISSIAKARAGR